jgi:hypothetical protein
VRGLKWDDGVGDESDPHVAIHMNAGLESPANRQTRMSAPHYKHAELFGLSRVMAPRRLKAE